MESKPFIYYKERFRPQIHFSPETNFLNDPNGLVYFEGEYHLFYQHNPYGMFQDPHNAFWGHAISTDLLHWQHMPVQLGPDQYGGMASGSGVVDWHDSSGLFGGKPGLVLMYTCYDWNAYEAPGIAYSRDRGRSWEKYGGNPVLPNQGLRAHLRDPKVLWYEPTQRWIMVLGGGPLRIYSSVNLLDWQEESVLEDISSECPDLFELPIDGEKNNTKWVINMAGRYIYLGSFDGHRFTPESDKIDINYGPDSYAAQSWSDIPAEDGRWIMINWMMTWAYALNLDIIPTRPWNGAITIPHELTLASSDSGIKLMQKPIREIETIREKSYSCSDIEITGGSVFVPEIRGMSLDIEVEFEMAGAAEFGLEVLQSDRTRQHLGDKILTVEQETTVVSYSTYNKQLVVDRTNSGVTHDEKFAKAYSAPLLPKNNRIKLRIITDCSSVETFANDGEVVITTQVFPLPYSDNVKVFAKGGSVRLLSLKIHRLKSVWAK